jgi:ELWxxDGT repeat protein
VSGTELWESDGTEAGTLRLSDINPVTTAKIYSITDSNGTLFFLANDGDSGDELWAYGRVSLELFGVPLGGSVSFSIAGVSIGVATSPGDTIAQILSALETEVNGNAALITAGIHATSDGQSLFVGRLIAAVVVADPGLSLAPQPTPVPALWSAGRALLLLGMMAVALTLVRKGRQSQRM